MSDPAKPTQNMKQVVITAALRTPIGRFNGGLAAFSAVDLISETGLLQALLKEAKVDAEAVEEVIIGNVLSAGLGQNVARQVAIRSGLPFSVPAMTINRVCASSLTAIDIAAKSIACGAADVIIAGGTESMSNAPYVLKRQAKQKMGDLALIDTMVQDGLWDAFYDCHMGMTAENIVTEWSLSRAAQDDYALHSHQKAVHAQKTNAFNTEIFPIAVKTREGSQTIARDEGPRADTSEERLAKLKPAFKENGSVTAANASSINDGAALVMLTSIDYAKEHGLPILAKIMGTATVGIDPKIMGHAPYSALLKLMKGTHTELEAVDIFEINEAFSAQCLSVTQNLKLDTAKINIQGGAIALGHPIGASGARIVVTLLHAMKRLRKRLGVASLCVGGGQGVAMLFEAD